MRNNCSVLKIAVVTALLTGFAVFGFRLPAYAAHDTAKTSKAAEDAKAASKNDFKRFSIGFRWRGWEMTSKDDWYGTVSSDRIDENTFAWPSNVNVQYLVNKYFGLVAEMDWFNATMEKDGKLDWKVLTLGATFRYPIKDRFIPYVVGGITYNFVKFEENNWWHYGFPGNAEFDAWDAQRPADTEPVDWWKSYNDKQRDFRADDGFGWTVGGGMDVMLTDMIALNMDLRWNWAQTDVDYTIAFNDGKDRTDDHKFTYDLDTFSYSVGIRFYF